MFARSQPSLHVPLVVHYRRRHRACSRSGSRQGENHMTQGQGNSAPLYCPGCGGLMHKATGSTLYWHADTNHARCSINTIVDTLLEGQLAQPSDPNNNAGGEKAPPTHLAPPPP